MSLQPTAPVIKPTLPIAQLPLEAGPKEPADREAGVQALVRKQEQTSLKTSAWAGSQLHSVVVSVPGHQGLSEQAWP